MEQAPLVNKTEILTDNFIGLTFDNINDFLTKEESFKYKVKIYDNIESEVVESEKELTKIDIIKEMSKEKFISVNLKDISGVAF